MRRQTMFLATFVAFTALLSTCFADDTNAIYHQLETLQHNLSALQEIRAPPWVSATNMRGTSSILYSGLLTLFACVYTALHLNIPERRAGFFRVLRTKCFWVMVTLVAPEIVLFYAFSQFSEARKLVKTLREYEIEQGLVSPSEDPTCSTDLQRRPTGGAYNDCKFDLNYGFFVVMGGFEIEIPDQTGPESAKTVLRTLSPQGAAKLASKTVAPLRVPKFVIEDRSKADTLQKLLVLLQVSWMVIQCIARKVSGLPLTLLELHTMVHVVCAAAMYGFWLKKPLDLRSPEKIDPLEYGDLFTELDKLHFYPRHGDFPDFEWSSFEYYIFDKRYLLVLLTTLSIVYGGIHLSAWNFGFPTATEEMLWKVASIFITVAIPFIFGVFVVTVGVDSIIEIWSDNVKWESWAANFSVAVGLIVLGLSIASPSIYCGRGFHQFTERSYRSLLDAAVGPDDTACVGARHWTRSRGDSRWDV